MILFRNLFVGSEHNNDENENIWLFDQNSKLVNSKKCYIDVLLHRPIGYVFPEVVAQTCSQIQISASEKHKL
jgi:hypothetical protein